MGKEIETVEEVKDEEVEATDKGEEKESPEPELKYSDEDLNRIFGEKFARLKAKHEQEIDEAKKYAQMDAKEKIEFERDKLQAQLDELEKERTRNEMSKEARKILSNSSITVPDELIEVLVTDQAETTKTNVDNFVKAFEGALNSRLKEIAREDTPKAGANVVGNSEPFDISKFARENRIIKD